MVQNPLKFMGRPIEYVDSTELLGVSVTSRIRERNVKAVSKRFIVGLIVFYMILNIYQVMLKLNFLTLIV